MGRAFGVSLVALALVSAVPAAWAGSPHFVGGISVVRSGNTVIVSGKEAGLGNETQVHIVLTFSAACINGGGTNPSASNKESFTVEGTFPVQNGRAEFTLSGSATFKPKCSPPMTLSFSDISVCDVDHDVCQSFPGNF
jgi:hypothetical protein